MRPRACAAPRSQPFTVLPLSATHTPTAGYTKVPFMNAAAGQPDDNSPNVVSNSTSILAVCVHRQTVAAGSKQLPLTEVRVVASNSECKALGAAWRLVAGDVGSVWPGAKPAFLCVTSEGVPSGEPCVK